MKKLNATLITICILTFGCDRCPQTEKYYDIEGVHLQNEFNSLARTNPNFEAFYSQDSVKFEYFTLKTSYSLRYYSLQQQNAFSFIPAAYALDCVEPGNGGTKEKIESLTLLALSDYNSRFKTGDTLNAIINVNGLSVSNYIENQNQFTVDLFGFLINLTEKPDTAVKHSFKLIYKLQNGEIYEAESQPIKIL